MRWAGVAPHLLSHQGEATDWRASCTAPTLPAGKQGRPSVMK